MTAMDRLNNYRAKFRSTLSARKISEPLVRALYEKQEMWFWRDALRDAAKPSAEADTASDEYARARGRYESVILLERSVRRMERAA